MTWTWCRSQIKQPALGVQFLKEDQYIGRVTSIHKFVLTVWVNMEVLYTELMTCVYLAVSIVEYVEWCDVWTTVKMCWVARRLTMASNSWRRRGTRWVALASFVTRTQTSTCKETKLSYQQLKCYAAASFCYLANCMLHHMDGMRYWSHRAALIYENASVGKGTLVSRHARIVNSTIGENCKIGV